MSGPDPTMNELSEQISPDPTDEEAAAIAAALLLAWPTAPSAEPVDRGSTLWRYSGRWWNKPTWRRR